MTPPRSLIAKTSAVSAATLGSRVLGFARDVGTAAVLGAGPLADALMAALSLPLLARRLLADGAFNAAMLPALAKAEDDTQAAAVANATLALLGTLLTVLALAGALAMPVIMMILAPGFSEGGERADLAIACGQLAIFYLPLAGAAAVLGGIANAAHRVLLPALAPMLANAVVLVAIAFLLLEGWVATPAAAMVMAACAVISGIAQMMLMMVAAHRAPASLRLNAGFAWAAARRVLRASGPALLFAGLPQLRLLIVAAMVSSVPGAVSALNYAQRLIDLPLGLVGASAGAVLVPLLTTGRARRPGVETTRAALAALAFALPAATGLLVLAEPIIAVLYQRGSFTAQDTAMTAALLAALALALPAQGLEKIFSAAAMSHGLTGAAERAGIVSLVNAAVLAAGLGLGIGPTAGACAVALSACYGAVRLGLVLQGAGHLALSGDVWRQARGLLLACLAMAGVVLGLAWLWPSPGAGFAAALRLGVLVAAGMATYGALWLLLRRRLAARAGDA
ncbi:murein biosynthesis integral membrane protein MurJ [Aquabacter cavernae]|uniref:murein biosynthesis integral membrane protein MurJ n=1 Tax=Aquabacter cavernae TaxID=2496029 RepID=UPI000F8DB584|nr:murein biosynthesis integral membrane protein MurJ [Aquabacter cavernae]